MRVFVLFIFLSFVGFSQSGIEISKNPLPNTRDCKNNPAKLAARLTEGLSSDKEKFDMIYTWVVKNISYDYKAYSSLNGAKFPDIGKVLGRKKAMCMGYAALMDTLCGYAGINNVSVFGYTKDNLFDVNDSIYVDNHAWNAVRLDQNWYVYDATWSSGTYEIKFKWLSRLVIRWINKLGSKRKIKKHKFKYTSKRKSNCGKEKVVHIFEESRIPLLNRILIKILSKKNLRYKMTFDKTVNLNYYLTQPEVFAINHYPDNPYWSLTDKIRKMSDFEGDSAYYYLNESVYENQRREGRYCFECDQYLSMNTIEKAQQMKSNSANFNQKNGFITWLCDITIGEYYFDESNKTEDSTSKVSLLDSANLYFSNGRTSLKKYAFNIKSESRFHKAKNLNKKSILLKQNREQTKWLKAITDSSYRKLRTLKTIDINNFNLFRRNYSVLRRLSKLQPKKVKNKLSPPERIAYLQNELNRSIIRTDSLNVIIDEHTSRFYSLMNQLSINVWKQLNVPNSLYAAFKYDAYLRKVPHLDSYKKIIVEERLRINELGKYYRLRIQDSVFSLVDATRNLHSIVINLSNDRNAELIKSTRFINLLIQENVLSSDSLKHFIQSTQAKIENGRCKTIKETPKIGAASQGMRYLIKVQRFTSGSIQQENRAENYRYKIINNHILNRKQRHTNIEKNNVYFTNYSKTKVIKEKKRYLKSLSDKRKKEKLREKKISK